jgi:hypothetical protein
MVRLSMPGCRKMQVVGGTGMSTIAMTGRIAEVSPRQLARIAGGLYLINIVTGAFAVGYVQAALIVPGNAAATVHNIQAHELLYRWGLVAHLITLLTNVPLALIFYDLFKVVNRRFAVLVVFFTLVGTAIEGANLLDQFAPLLLLGGTHYLMNVFSPEQVQALAYMPLDAQALRFNISEVFFVGYLLCAAYLIFRSSFLPRVLSVLLAIGGVCYLTYAFADFLAPEFAAHLVPAIQVPSGLAEISLALWLLMVGLNPQRWQEQARATGALARS